ncbi:MAG: hypothetical protein PHU91_01025 [Candidatus Omnitrophica bacterium]|nr:hypothetical protein [Candidatus Omnitrophota bacterium]MDD5236242.1 hypothetical protein [Candidatus Omnitrophota bacterium]MDD5610051.1 hypothetical protein [Candidatus Omnitrophota bacterium]
MGKKGLCDTCIHGISCVLPTRFPVLECEEFSTCGSSGKLRKQEKIQRTVSSYAAIESE